MRSTTIMERDARKLCRPFMIEPNEERVQRVVDAWKDAEKRGMTTGPATVTEDDAEAVCTKGGY